MYPRAIAISIDNGFDLVAVREKDSRRWHLLRLTRPLKAIALYQENPKARLVFLAGVNLNHLEQKILKKNSIKGKGNNYSFGAKR